MAAYDSSEYRRASHQKYRAAVDAHTQGHYVVSHYLAGVAVECMLRAFRWSTNPSWDAQHDLKELMKKGGVLQRLSPRAQPIVRDALNSMAVRWHISHRYAPNDRVEDFLKKTLATSSRRILKDNSEYMLQQADIVLKECEKIWP